AHGLALLVVARSVRVAETPLERLPLARPQPPAATPAGRRRDPPAVRSPPRGVLVAGDGPERAEARLRAPVHRVFPAQPLEHEVDGVVAKAIAVARIQVLDGGGHDRVADRLGGGEVHRVGLRRCPGGAGRVGARSPTYHDPGCGARRPAPYRTAAPAMAAQATALAMAPERIALVNASRPAARTASPTGATSEPACSIVSCRLAGMAPAPSGQVAASASR